MTLPQDINAVFMLDLNVNRHHNHLFTALIKCHFRFVVKFEVEIKCCTCQMNQQAMQNVAQRHPELITPIYTPVDATNVPPKLSFPACTIISAFHHFSPTVAQDILKNCVDQNRAVFIVEPFTRNLKRATAPVPALATAAYLHPLKAEKRQFLKAFFTYGVPLIPLIGAWDATISFFRIYSKKMLMDMVTPFKKSFHWRYEEVPYTPFGTALVFYGIPKRKS